MTNIATQQKVIGSTSDRRRTGRLGIWLFLAAEIMFFVGLLGSYVVLRAENAESFAKMSRVLNKPLVGIGTIALILSCLTTASAVSAAKAGRTRKLAISLILTIILAGAFLSTMVTQFRDNWFHQTVIARAPGDVSSNQFVYDGSLISESRDSIVLHGVRSSIATSLDLHDISPADVRSADAAEKDYTVAKPDILDRDNYFPWRNIFFACYFTLTSVHALHVIAGMAVLLVLFAQAARGKPLPAATEYLSLYWYFLTAVWLILFPLLYW